MADLSQVFDYFGGIVVAASTLVGLIQVGSSFGSLTDIVGKMVSSPAGFGLGMLLFLIGYSTWTPAIPKAFLDGFYLGWLPSLYPFANGYFMGFSLWALLFTLVLTIAVTLLAMHVWELEFWFEGFGVALVSFLGSWYAWGWIAWELMFVGGGMMGLSGDQAYALWSASVSATSSSWLQLFFLASIPISATWLSKKVASLL
jgi:hypothetical protein